MKKIASDANGGLLGSGSWCPRMEPVVPGSMGYLMVEAICAR